MLAGRHVSLLVSPMPTATDALDENRSAVDDLIRTAEAAASVWTTPRAPGKWSPSQVVEHVARALDESANVVAGRPTRLPTVPFLLRPLARMFFNRVLRTGRFMKSKATKAMDPIEGSATPAEARARLEQALARFEEEVRACSASGGKVRSPAFGTVSLEGYASFTALHTRHHTKQIPVIL